MKRRIVIVAVLAMAVFTDGSVESAKRVFLGQDDSAQKVSGALGTMTNPVRCEGPKGEVQYLNRLRCSDGKRPESSRIGSVGRGPYGNILDGYGVKCEGREDATIYMDMYHKGYIEKEAVPGFTIVNE